jgi:hypothetical protein
MNIWALEGHKVKVTKETKNNGYDSDKKAVARLLKLEKEYEVEWTDVSNFSTRVKLKDIDYEFNSVNFVDVTEQSEELDKEHPDWSRYN